MRISIPIKFKCLGVPEGLYSLNVHQYPNGRPAFVLRDTDGEAMAMLTVNFPQNRMIPGEVAIKDHNGEEGVMQRLVDEGVVALPHRYIESGFVHFPICMITQSFRDKLKAIYA